MQASYKRRTSEVFRIMKKIILVGFLLTACASSKQIVGPDGSNHLLITCSEIVECYEKARKECGGEYTIANSTSSTSGISGTITVTQELLVKCKK